MFEFDFEGIAETAKEVAKTIFLAPFKAWDKVPGYIKWTIYLTLALIGAYFLYKIYKNKDDLMYVQT